MSILITGASGFVGTNLSFFFKKLNLETELVSIRYSLDNKFNYKRNVIIHLSGLAHDLKKKYNINDYLQSNFELTKQLYDSFLNSEAKVFIFMSSINSVSFDKNEFVTEENIKAPLTFIGKSKRNAEQYILSKPLPEGKRVFILRPCMIHGPGNKGNLNLLYKIVSKRIPWPLGAFENKRSFCSIDNVCYVINEIINKDSIPSGIYNLADDETISTNELIELIGLNSNKKSIILKIPKSIIKLIFKFGDLFKLPINSEQLDKLTENFVVSNEKIKKALNIDYLPTSTKDGLIKTIQFFNK